MLASSIKYELKVFKRTILRILPYLIILFIISCIQFYLDLTSIKIIPMKRIYFSVLGIPIKDSISLVFGCRVIIYLFLIVYYFSYELNNSSEFIFLRTNKNKLYVIKFIIINIFTLLIRLFLTYGTYYLLFKQDFDMDVDIFINSVIVYVLIILVVSLTNLIVILKKYYS